MVASTFKAETIGLEASTLIRPSLRDTLFFFSSFNRRTVNGRRRSRVMGRRGAVIARRNNAFHFRCCCCSACLLLFCLDKEFGKFRVGIFVGEKTNSPAAAASSKARARRPGRRSNCSAAIFSREKKVFFRVSPRSSSGLSCAFP